MRSNAVGTFWSALRYRHRAWRYRLRHERAQVQVLLEHLRPGDTAVDIGAHKGAYTYWMRRAVSPVGRVFAFEPQPELASYLRSRNAKRPGRADVIVESVALSSRSETARLNIPSSGPSPGASLGSTGQVAVRSVSVRCDTLDSYLASAQAEAVRLIKCDVEGHELEVLRGAERTLQTDRPLLLMECEARHRQDGCVETVFHYLRDLAYSGRFHDGVRWRDVSEFRAQAHQDSGRSPYINNFVFRRDAATDPA